MKDIFLIVQNSIKSNLTSKFDFNSDLAIAYIQSQLNCSKFDAVCTLEKTTQGDYYSFVLHYCS